MRNCDICGRPITLSPSASERAAKYGGTAAFYTNLFPTHTECALKKRADAATELMRRYSEHHAYLNAQGFYTFRNPQILPPPL